MSGHVFFMSVCVYGYNNARLNVRFTSGGPKLISVVVMFYIYIDMFFLSGLCNSESNSAAVSGMPALVLLAVLLVTIANRR